jgi:hypothetical protein
VTNQMARYAYRQKGTGRPILTLWFSGLPPGDANATTPVDLSFTGVTFLDPVYADLRTGMVCAIPPESWSKAGSGVTFRQVPLYDSPVLIAERSTLPLVPLTAAPGPEPPP